MAFQLEAIMHTQIIHIIQFFYYTLHMHSYSNFTFKLAIFSFYKTLKLGVKNLPRMHVQVRDQNEQMHPHAHYPGVMGFAWI